MSCGTQERKGSNTWGEKSKFSNGGGASGGGGESPKPTRKRFGSSSEEQLARVNGSDASSPATAADIEQAKQDILREMRSELAKIKQDIIEGN